MLHKITLVVLVLINLSLSVYGKTDKQTIHVRRTTDTLIIDSVNQAGLHRLYLHWGIKFCGVLVLSSTKASITNHLFDESNRFYDSESKANRANRLGAKIQEITTYSGFSRVRFTDKISYDQIITQMSEVPMTPQIMKLFKCSHALIVLFYSEVDDTVSIEYLY